MAFGSWWGWIDGGGVMAEKPKVQKLDELHAHEALDRLHVVLSMIDEHLLLHPYIENRPVLLRLVGTAATALSDAYQVVALEHLP